MTTEGSNLDLHRHALWVVGCRIVGIAATLASNILAARLLGPAEFGSYLLVTTVIALGSLLAMAGLNEAALRFIAESFGLGKQSRAAAYARRAVTITAWASLAASVVVTVSFAGFLAVTRQSLPSLALLALVAIGIAVLAWQQLGAELLRAYGNLRLASFFSGGQTGGPVSNLVFLAGLGLATALTARLDATVAIAVSVASICATCPLVFASLARVSHAPLAELLGNEAKLSRQQGSELLSVGGILLVNQLFVFATQQLDILVAGGMLTSVDLGLYGAAKRSLLVAALPVQMATLTIVSSIPRLFAQSKMVELEKVVRTAASVAAVPSLFALGVLTLFPGPVLGFFLRDSYSQAGHIVVILGAGYFALIVFGNAQYVLTMTGRHRAVLAVNCISAVVLFAASIVGASQFGAAGLAAGSALSLLVQNGTLWWLTRRELGIWTHIGVPARNKLPTHVTEQHLPPRGHARQADIIHSAEAFSSSPV